MPDPGWLGRVGPAGEPRGVLPGDHGPGPPAECSGSDGRGVGFYFRNVTEILLFGVRGKNARTLPPGRSQVNMIQTRKREHSRKPDEQYPIIEECSPGPSAAARRCCRPRSRA
mgnify:CR=1 FL=1